MVTDLIIYTDYTANVTGHKKEELQSNQSNDWINETSNF